MNPPTNPFLRFLPIPVILLAALLAIVALHSRAATPDPTALYVSVVDHGAAGDGVTDDTNAINTAISWAKTNGYKTLFFPAGAYRITSELAQLNSSFNMVSVVGENPGNTIVRLDTETSTGPVIQTSGGSGQIILAEIRGLTFSGNGANTAIRIRGTGGVRIRDCIFQNLETGIEFSNDIAPGTFTEFSVAEGCVFWSSCKTAVRFISGAGDPSFHGSGLLRCTINRAATNSEPAIRIGNSGEYIYLYNAPLDFTVWTRSEAAIIHVESASSSVFTHGVIQIENMAGSLTGTVSGGAGTVYHAGEITSWGNISMGRLVQVDSFKRNSDGSINPTEKLQRIQTTLSSATTTISACKAGELGAFASVALTASNYDYRYLLFFSHDGYGGSGYVTILANQRSFNSAGLGAPTFSVDTSGHLVVTNKNYADKSIDLKVGLLTTGGRKQFY